jgi:DHA1 family bicyclomycin/chloramphenicol resistance-like MFS transporter
VFAPTYGWLIAERTLQGVGAAAGPSLARTVLRDVYGPARSASVMGYLMAGFGVMAVLAPVIGGALTEGFGGARSSCSTRFTAFSSWRSAA